MVYTVGHLGLDILLFLMNTTTLFPYRCISLSKNLTYSIQTNVCACDGFAQLGRPEIMGMAI